MTTEGLKTLTTWNHCHVCYFKMSSDKEIWEKKTVHLLTGDSQVTHRPVFTKDSK